MSDTSAGVALSGECLRSKGKYGSCRWQVKLYDPLAIEPYLRDDVHDEALCKLTLCFTRNDSVKSKYMFVDYKY